LFSACSGLFPLVKYNLKKSKNINSSTKGLMGFLSFGGRTVCLFGGLIPPKPMPSYVSGWRGMEGDREVIS